MKYSFTKAVGSVAVALSLVAGTASAQSFFNFVGAVDLYNDPANPANLRVDFVPNGGPTGTITSTVTTNGVFAPIGVGTTGTITDLTITGAGAAGTPINPFVVINGYTFTLTSTPMASGGSFTFGPIKLTQDVTGTTASFGVTGTFTGSGGAGNYVGIFTTQFAGQTVAQVLASVNSPAGITNQSFSATFASAVPEPSTYALMGTGLVGLLGFARRRRNQA